jgi:hypothetical protein
MFDWIRDVDHLLRGGYTWREELASGRISLPVRTLVVSGCVLGAVYGVFMGLFAVLRPEASGFAQLAATMFKVPLLFLLTLAVTFPSLYVFSALSNSRLGTLDTLKLLLAAVTANLAVLASFGPVTGFFTLSTDSYAFMIVLNVFMFTVAGAVGIFFLQRALRHLTGPEAPDPDTTAGKDKPVDRPARPNIVLGVWTIIYALVGSQMGWILRPFIGSPDLPFALFRQREGSFFEGFFSALGRLLTG